MTFHECRGARKDRSVWSPHVPKRRSGIIVFLTVKHDAEPPKTPCRPLRTTGTLSYRHVGVHHGRIING
ncbi:hypothetical protein ALC60_11225 [Trachymyrmex zeteki]|uniref:Uncharacterized protein n=1 Tax=Mycetomoellerius zeteki TaxID=64791 RepID=A0A151WPG4_9HYME|nr:hypothetical protein ALC60_11225 [Trachymyrmex zeteki]